nr:unnamed protein product [Callosobruchus chinensis]
MQSSEG